MSDVPPPNIIITHCPHGLDLRIHPRCYLCKPRRLEWQEAGDHFVPVASTWPIPYETTTTGSDRIASITSTGRITSVTVTQEPAP